MRVLVWPNSFATTIESTPLCFNHEAKVRRRSLGVTRRIRAALHASARSRRTLHHGAITVGCQCVLRTSAKGSAMGTLRQALAVLPARNLNPAGFKRDVLLPSERLEL